MKRYLVFGMDNYYPAGGWDDFKGTFDSIEEAREFAQSTGSNWHQIIDTTTMKEVPYAR